MNHHGRNLKSLLPQLLEDAEYHPLIMDLCVALVPRRYRETSDTINLVLRLLSNKLSGDNKNELLTLGVFICRSISQILNTGLILYGTFFNGILIVLLHGIATTN